MILFDKKFNCHQFIGDYLPTGEHYYFDNGQHGERTEITARWEYSLSYHYGRVYISKRRQYHSGGAFGMCSGPITNISAKETEIAKLLFEADKAAGVIPKDYIFH